MDLGITAAAAMSFPTPYDTAYTKQARQQQTLSSQSHITPSLYPPPLPPLPATHQPPKTTYRHQQQQQQQQHPPPSHQIRSVKRARPVRSCAKCRKRKLRCDRLCPCSQCQKSSRTCKYTIENDSSNLSDASDGEATKPVRRSAKRSYVPAATVGGSGVGAGRVGDGPYASAQSGELSVRPLLEELAGRMERLEKHLMGTSPAETTDAGCCDGDGGSNSCKRGVEVSPRTVRGFSVKQRGTRTRLWGPSSPRVLLNLVCATFSGGDGMDGY